MKQLILIPALSVLLAGCAGFDIPQILPMPSAPDAGTTTSAPVAPPPPVGAVTVEQFDTTSAEDREDAVVSTPLSQGALGQTIATLGDPAAPGFWLETPLVSSETEGRVTAANTGRTVKVTLRPISGPNGAGSRISLSALRLLDLPLAGLHELEVYGL
ncbi:hypothetical protein [Aliiroseovarius lamellibrachiae]|uniref:hypothetical protein n=1 Tax=Aliiroseovarius lamellibrachiae TaxID=1924933 RepID=UPI001BE03E78|nr:hypothetical protein [Aliiroseovarius lamellibrachiae]MBT2130891.1 hypothetical protein [Aliiroseovarius lamellibrachiae]